mgnify:FL=1
MACTAQAGRNRDTDSRPALKCSQNLDGRLSSRAQFLSLCPHRLQPTSFGLWSVARCLCFHSFSLGVTTPLMSFHPPHRLANTPKHNAQHYERNERNEPPTDSISNQPAEFTMKALAWKVQQRLPRQLSFRLLER